MSPRARHSATARHHVEWLQLVDVSGPFLTLSVLVETFPQGLDADDPEVAERLRQAVSEWQANEELRRPDRAIHREFLRFVLREVLDYEGLLAQDAEIADLKATLPEHRVTLRPDLAVRSKLAGEIGQCRCGPLVRDRGVVNPRGRIAGLEGAIEHGLGHDAPAPEGR